MQNANATGKRPVLGKMRASGSLQRENSRASRVVRSRRTDTARDGSVAEERHPGRPTSAAAGEAPQAPGLAERRANTRAVPGNESLQRLDKSAETPYTLRDMDSLNDLRVPAAVLSSQLWNWWAVPTAR